MYIRDVVGWRKSPRRTAVAGEFRAVFEAMEPRLLLTGDPTVSYHAVLVGIADYDGVIDDLEYADDDARDLQQALLMSSAWDAENIHLLTDHAATKTEIRSAIEDAAAVMDADDVFVFSFAGHGGPEPDAAPHEEADGLDEVLYSTDMTPIWDDELADWLAALPTDNQVVIIDACNSGGMIQSDRGVFLTAAAEDGLSYEELALENGIFTYFFVEGMTPNDGSVPAETNGDGSLSAEEIYAYAAQKVRDFTITQNPQTYDGHEGTLNFLPLSFAPLADPAGPYILQIGDGVDLDAGASVAAGYEIVSYQWDLDDDGIFETDAAGSAVFSVSYDALVSLGLAPGGQYDIHLRITDDSGKAATADTTLALVAAPGDANLNGLVDDEDLSVLLANWTGPEDQGKTWAQGDFEGNGNVGTNDLSLLLANWHAAADPLPAEGAGNLGAALGQSRSRSAPLPGSPRFGGILTTRTEMQQPVPAGFAEFATEWRFSVTAPGPSGFVGNVEGGASADGAAIEAGSSIGLLQPPADGQSPASVHLDVDDVIVTLLMVG